MEWLILELAAGGAGGGGTGGRCYWSCVKATAGTANTGGGGGGACGELVHTKVLAGGSGGYGRMLFFEC